MLQAAGSVSKGFSKLAAVCCCWLSVFPYQALQLSHMKHLNDDSLAALVTSAQNIRVLGLQEPGRCVAAPCC